MDKVLSRKKLDIETAKTLGIAVLVLGIGTVIDAIASVPVCGTNYPRLMVLGIAGVLGCFIGNYGFSIVPKRRDDKTVFRYICGSFLVCCGSIVILVTSCVHYVSEPCHGVDETAIAFVAVQAKLTFAGILIGCVSRRSTVSLPSVADFGNL